MTLWLVWDRLVRMDAGRVDPGVTLEAIGPLAVPFNGLIELQRPITRGLRNPDHYLLHMLLTGGGLTQPHLK